MCKSREFGIGRQVNNVLTVKVLGHSLFTLNVFTLALYRTYVHVYGLLCRFLIATQSMISKAKTKLLRARQHSHYSSQRFLILLEQGCLKQTVVMFIWHTVY